MSAPSTVATPAPLAADGVPVDPHAAALSRIVSALGQLAEDGSVPRNVRRGAQSAKEELGRARVALDMRISSAVSVLDELANDPNLPTHGRTAIWTIISSLEAFR